MTVHPNPYTSQTDYDLHGVVGIRLLDARPGDAALVTRQLSSTMQRTLDREPDITIRFVDRLETSSRVRLLGIDDAGFTDDAFLVLRGKYKSRARVQIPFDDIGQRRCDIVAERGLTAVPLLIAIINLTMLAKGFAPLHAAAFEYNGIGALATGWAKGGKTEMLLAFVTKGARYVGDEWVYLSRDGQQMLGIPEPVRLWKWHLDDMPSYWAMVSRGDRWRLKGLDFTARLMDRISENGLVRRTPPMRLMRRVTPVLKRQLSVQIPPKRLFGEVSGSTTSAPQKIFFIGSHDALDMRLEKIDPARIAQRMVFSHEEERADFMSYYMKFRFAFPERCNDLIDSLADREREMLGQALAGKDAYSLYHPYPVSIPLLYEAARSVFEPS